MNESLLPRSGVLLCAVSGGADSVYLLHKLRELAGETGYVLECAHFNHCLRGAESDRDEDFVRGLCEALGIRAHFGRGEVAAFAARMGLGEEDAARRLRYAFLEETADKIGAIAIATAHTADDNAETMLLNLARGAGLRGLCGIPERRGRIIRPMLGVTRREVEEYLAERGITHVEDSSNARDDYARNRIRHRAVPALLSVNPEFAQAAGRAAVLLRRDEDFLTGLAEKFLAEHPEGIPCAELLELPLPVSTRALRLAAGVSMSEQQVQAALELAGGAGLGYLSLPGTRLKRERGILSFGAQSEPEPLPERELVLDGETLIPEAGISLICRRLERAGEIHSSLNTFFFKCENICGTITCTSRQPGDRIRLQGRGCTKKLKELFSERGLTLAERVCVPVLRDGAGPLAVCGFGVAERALPGPEDAALRIDISKIHNWVGGQAK